MSTRVMDRERAAGVGAVGDGGAAAGRWRLAGRLISGFVVLFLLVDGVLRIAGFGPYVEGTTRFGFPAEMGAAIGMTLVVSTVLYALPRTAALGAILVTAYLGGAVAGHVQLGDPLIFPVLMGVLTWAGLYLRDPRVRALLPVRQNVP